MIDWWQGIKLDAMLAPFETQDNFFIASKIIEDPAELAGLNPFAPVMPINSALNAIDFITERTGQRVAVFMKPCELRAFTELKKRKALTFNNDEVIIIGVDCLGTYSRKEFASLVEASDSASVTTEVLRNAAEGGLRPQHFRMACQICEWPGPKGADVTFGIIGVNSEKFLLLIVKDEETDEQLGISPLTDCKASEYQVSHREVVVGAIADTRADMREHFFENDGGTRRFNELGSFLAWMASCSLCGRCLNACPHYRGEFRGKFGRVLDGKTDRHVLSELVNLGRWIASCTGCGMCEQACDRDVPLTLLLSSLSHHIRAELNYCPGDPLQQIPWQY